MTDMDILRKMSQDVLVIPFTEEIAKTLNQFCGKYAEAMGRERFEELTLSFLNRKNDKKLTDTFETFCKEQGLANKLSQAAIMPVLAEHIVLRAIESAKPKERSLFSLLLKNALILAVKGNGFTAYPQAISDTFNIYYNYLMDERTFGKEDDGYRLTHSLLDSDKDSWSKKVSNADGEVLKSLVYNAATLRYKEMVEGMRIDADNLLKSIYETAKKLVTDAPWIYIDHAPAKTIKKILAGVVNSEFELSDVIENLKDVVSGEDDKRLKTSILLRLIGGDDDGIELTGKTKFKASELAVYLYYELMAEAIAKEINETEK